MATKPAYLESPESASPIVTRAVAAGLQGMWHTSYQLAGWQKFALQLLGALPQQATRWVLSRVQPITALPARRLAGLSVEQLAETRLGDYAGLAGRFPCLTIGAALGGAAAHLSLALGAPFLPQAFVLTMKGGSPGGEAEVYLQRSLALALEIARRNPGILTIQHYDPVHDGWLTRRVNHLRLKLLSLPEAYAAFIRQRLEPGGALCYLECGARWLRYRLGERSVFQVGGWGDIPPREFLEGSPRLERFCRSEALRACRWPLGDYPLEEGSESEWGSEAAFGEALEAFCRTHGYHLVRIALPEPHDFSRLAFRALLRLLQREGRQPAGASIEMFSQFDASAVFKAGLLPLWLVFNTTDSLRFLEQMRPEFPPDRPVFFACLATLTDTPDLTPWSAWEGALAGFDWRNVGARPDHYPSDALAIARWGAALRQWVQAHERPIRSRLAPEELHSLCKQIAEGNRRSAAP